MFIIIFMLLDLSNIPDISSENEPLDVQTFVKKQMDNWYCVIINLVNCDLLVC